ncbi:MAG: toprim domain-containing protein [Candidatus Aenigmatarchaeota archaeon]
MLNQEIEEQLFKILEEIKDRQVIVEGKRDKEALCLFGFTKIITINRGLYETAEDIRGKEVIVLTDFDAAGKEIAKKLNIFLQSLGYKVDRETRREIGFLFTRMKIRKIEELRGVKNE